MRLPHQFLNPISGRHMCLPYKHGRDTVSRLHAGYRLSPPCGTVNAMHVRGRIEFEGIVQGVGFRPALHRFALDLGLAGWVMNTSAGVLLELEGPRGLIEEFIRLVREEGPPLARVLVTRVRWLPLAGFAGFEIRGSEHLPGELTLLCPDVATCPDCLRELFDPADRRYRYPFINCTNCGPRYTIVKSLPYDRPATTMAGFPLCPDCAAEYADPADRRYHAQPVACAACGPRLWYKDASGELPGDAITLATEALLAGRTIAIRGLGGFHLACRADDDDALLRLRRAKGRSFFKPLAVMVPTLDDARRICEVDDSAAELLASSLAPIILLPLRDSAEDTAVSRYAAPRLGNLGVMLPYTPIHHLLLREVGVPLVMTSGNLSDEPIITDNDAALDRLAGIADGFLLHDRPIHSRCDDSVLFSHPPVGQTVYRHSRGFTPFPIALPEGGPAVLALGGDIKTTFAASRDSFIFVSPHLGDAAHPATYAFLREAWEHYRSLFGLAPEVIASDSHPGYHTAQWAEELATEYGVPLVRVQHHHAHLAALLAEFNLSGPHTAIVADGTGYGADGTLWGGEVLTGDASSYTRNSHLRPIMLPGGDGAVREPWRIAMALIHGAQPDALDDYCALLTSGGLTERVAGEFPGRIPDSADPVWRPPDPADVRLVTGMLMSDTACTPSSALGRLFDGIAALLGVTIATTYEGQGPMELEALALSQPQVKLPIPISGGGEVIDWGPLVRLLITRSHTSAQSSLILHRWTARAFLDRALRHAPEGTPILATGGCLQNSLLRRLLEEGCNAAGRKLLTHRDIPPGDGGLAVGVLRIAQARFGQE